MSVDSRGTWGASVGGSNYDEAILSEKLEMLAQLVDERCCTGKWEFRVSGHNMLSKIDENTVFVLQCLCSEGNFEWPAWRGNVET